MSGDDLRLLPILERLRSLALEALQAAEADDPHLLLEILDQRQGVLDEAAPLLRRRSQTTETASSEIVLTLRGITAAEARLSAAVSARRETAASQLDGIGRRAAEGAGYDVGAASARSSRIDLRR